MLMPRPDFACAKTPTGAPIPLCASCRWSLVSSDVTIRDFIRMMAAIICRLVSVSGTPDRYPDVARPDDGSYFSRSNSRVLTPKKCLRSLARLVHRFATRTYAAKACNFRYQYVVVH
jgi:hypothetical protein